MRQETRELYKSVEGKGDFGEILGPEDKALMGTRYIAARDIGESFCVLAGRYDPGVFDLGCGAGHLYSYLRNIGWYVGVEASDYLACRAALRTNECIILSDIESYQGVPQDLVYMLGGLPTCMDEEVSVVLEKALQLSDIGCIVSFPIAGLYKGVFRSFSIEEVLSFVRKVVEVKRYHFIGTGDYGTLGIWRSKI